MKKIPIHNLHLRTLHRASFGFSLIELMVSITVGLLVLLAMVGVYVNLARSNNEMAKTNIQIENGRFAMQLLQTDIAHAGFWGGYIPQFDDFSSVDEPTPASDVSGVGTVPTGIPAPCRDYITTPWNVEYKSNLIGIPVQGYDAVPAGCADVVKNKKADTDVLIVRYAETCIPKPVSPAVPVAGVHYCEEVDTPGKLYMQSSNHADDSDRYVLDDKAAAFVLREKNGTIAPKRKFISHIYYIRDYAVAVGDGIPTLVRSQFDLTGSPATLKHQEPTALIEGIESFRVEFGIDNARSGGRTTNYTQAVEWMNEFKLTSPKNRGDGTPDGAFIRCASADPATDPCNVTKMTDAVAVKVFVLARSRETSPGHKDTKTYKLGSAPEIAAANDGFKRQVFSSTIRLSNVSGRRETPEP